MANHSRCPVSRCGKTIGRSMFMCKKHWKMVPEQVAADLSSAYGAGAMTLYSKALTAAVEMVDTAEKEGPGGQMSLL